MSSETEKQGKSWKKERGEREKGKLLSENEMEVNENNVEDVEKAEKIKSPDEREMDVDEMEGIIIQDFSTADLESSGQNGENINDEVKLKEEEKLEIMRQQEEEERRMLENYVSDLQERISKRAELRKKNLEVYKDRPELDTSRLDSSFKKNSAFIKKIKNLTESQEEALVKEFVCLNLSKYVSELAQAFVEMKLKMADVNTAINLCSLLHQRYAEFAPMLFQNWQKLLNLKKDEKVINLSKLRVDIRIYAELVSAGIFAPKEGLPLLGNVLTTLINSDKEEHHYISVILTFCRHCGEDYMGLLARKYRLANEKFNLVIPKSVFLKTERQKNVRSLMKEYYTSLIKHLINDHMELQKVELQNYRQLQTRGELTENRKALAENLLASLSKLLSNAHILADLLDEEVPEMPQWKAFEEEEGIIIENMDGEQGEAGLTQLWEDEDSQAFYTSLPQLKALLPSILYSESEKSTAAPLADEQTSVEEDLQEETIEEEIEIEENVQKESNEEELLLPELAGDEEQDESGAASSCRVLLDGFLSSLPNCISRDLIDNAALEFCLKLNTKPYRKKLVKSLFLVPRTRLDLLPFYARLVATLQPLMPDLASDLASMLKLDFRYQVRKKDQINIESKIKVVRFIGELTKFGIFQRSETLQCLRQLLQDFHHHHIEMACNLLETCGRYLYRLNESHHRTKIYLEQMMRKKTVKAFDPRYNTMIENAFYYVNPPELQGDVLKPERPPMKQYIRNLLYNILNRANTERILRQVRKLHWEDPDIADYMVKCLTAVWNAKFYNIRCLANLLAGLIGHYDWLGTAVVDGVLEDIRQGLEVNEPKLNQRRVAIAKYLGELYNYRVIESLVIFKVLYSFITFGVSWDPSVTSQYDPSDHLMRIRLVCTLLDTCGQFFSSGASKKRLDCFLTYFQHYYQFKRSLWVDEEFPWPIDHMVHDTVTGVRPKLTKFKNLQESQEAVANLNQQIINKAMQYMPELKTYMDEKSEGRVLEVISEEVLEPEQIEDSSRLTEDLFVDEDDDEEDGERPLIKVEGEEGEDHGAESLTPSQHSQRGVAEEDIFDDDTKEDDPSDGLTLTIKSLKCEEDDDFMSAFDRMLSDNLLERTREVARPVNTQISVPMNVKSTGKKSYDQLITEVEEESKPIVNFVLLTRSGNKQQCTNVEIPVDSDLVVKLRSREEAERAEKDRVKQLTLEINERQEEEEALELQQLSQHPALQNYNRERRPRYQHPKGAPDADLIFGPKKVR